MAPISSRMRPRYDAAVQTVLDLLYDNIELQDASPEHISELKGMFNRCLREDQWDWFSVFAELGEPPRDHLYRIVENLVHLRKALKEDDRRTAALAKQRLIKNNACYYLDAYQSEVSVHSGSERAGWIYVLSTREQPRILKIGMTQRSVSQRVSEINSATGILIPFSARRVFRVIDASQAERDIHTLLQSYRMRSDREFFELDIGTATSLIADYIEQKRIRQRQNGTLLWFDTARGYGFICYGKSHDVFVHQTEVRKQDQRRLQPGISVEFDLGHSPRGPFAIQASIVD